MSLVLILRYVVVTFILFGGSFFLLLVAVIMPFDVRIGYWFGQTVSKWSIAALGVKKIVEMDSSIPSHMPAVFISNHQHTLDLFVLSSSIPLGAIAMGKTTLRYIPIFGWLFWLAGHGLIDRKNRDRATVSLNKLSERMKKEKLSVLVFPEGTRSWKKGVGPFKKGAFRLARSTGFPVIPIVVSSYHKHVDMGRWNSGTVKVRFLEPVFLGDEKIELLIEKLRDKMKLAIDELDREMLS